MTKMICATTALWTVLASMALAGDSILINFTSRQCGPCRMMQPLLQTLENDGIPIRHVDVNRESALASRYGIRQTPTFVVMNEGREVTRMVGSQTAEKLRRALSISTQGPITRTRSDLTPPAIAPPRTRLAPIRQSAPNTPSFARDSSTTNSRDFGRTGLAGFSSSNSPAVESMPSQATADAVERAQAATVRLRVHDGKGYGAGTGTIIDTHGEEALVLTCGHLFRETGKQGRVEVDLFIAGETRTVPGQVIDYDAEDRDIALVAITPGFAVTPVRLSANRIRPQVGSAVFSFGCDRGDDPSRRDTRITGVNKYNQHLSLSNIEIGDAPVDGRSGGGLFDAQGNLIGVCNAADYKNNVGIYAGPGEVAWQLERVGLSRLLEATPPRQPAAVAMDAIAMGVDSAQPASPPQPLAATGNQEVIVIIRDKTTGSDRVVTMNDPSPEFMRMIRR